MKFTRGVRVAIDAANVLPLVAHYNLAFCLNAT